MELTYTPDVPVPARRFVPEDFDFLDLEAYAALVQGLIDRPVGSADELRDWIHDWSELSGAVMAAYSRVRTAADRDTRHPEYRARLRRFQREVLPARERHADALNRCFLASPYRAELGPEFAVLVRSKETAAEIFRDENTDLIARETELNSEWREIRGAFTVEVDGEELTAPQAGLKLRSRDRALRARVFEAMTRREAEDADRIDAIFDELVALRTRIGRNADFPNYRDYRFVQLNRFDYTPDDCEAFHAAVEKVVVPVVEELRAVRRRVLGLDELRPWDLGADLFGRGQERLFDDQAELVALGQTAFRAIDPGFAEDFDILVRNDLLDLMSRPGKAPGGYQATLNDIRLPFVFMNAVGTPRNLETLLHEGGHAFHTLACRDEPVIEYRRPPMEFAEVASMSMELFAFDRLGQVVGERRAREIAYAKLARLVEGFAAVALIDAFQHWIYTCPDHSREERVTKWIQLQRRFRPPIDWGELEEFRGGGWRQIPHLFNSAFYYIEYGIAQLGALQLWRLQREDHDRAVAAYRRALALGGSRPLPELFQAAEIRFAMDESIFRDLIPWVTEQLRELEPEPA
jgi:oligoendopeptidase F